MPVKFPILKKNHILIIGIGILIAGLIGASPEIYQRLSGQSGSLFNNGDILVQNENHQTSGRFSYLFPIINHPAPYYFPIMARGYAASIQDGSPVYISNFNHPDVGCNWAGVAGQVFQTDGSPTYGYTVVITGSINGKAVSLNGVTGGAQAYGIGGYEVQLSNAPFASTGTLKVNLLNTELKPVSAPISLTTYQDCQANLIVMNFRLIQ